MRDYNANRAAAHLRGRGWLDAVGDVFYNGVPNYQQSKANTIRMSTSIENKKITVIKPPRGWAFPNLREVWRYRTVITMSVSRNFKVQYRQTIGGPIYAVYEPFMNMIGYSLLLGGLLEADSEGIPYPIFTFSALIAWTLFTQTLETASTSLTANANLVTKIYVPRLVFPLIAAGGALMTFGMASLVLMVMMLLYGILPSAGVVMLPVYMFIALGMGLGMGMFFAGLHARFRDVQALVGFITRGLFFLTPVVYTSRIFPPPFDELYRLNPLAVVAEGFRYALIGRGTAPSVESIVSALLITLAVMLVGMLFFKRLESTVADVV
jgi:lipopolysaccharide transport system permease protein